MLVVAVLNSCLRNTRCIRVLLFEGEVAIEYFTGADADEDAEDAAAKNVEGVMHAYIYLRIGHYRGPQQCGGPNTLVQVTQGDSAEERECKMIGGM